MTKPKDEAWKAHVEEYDRDRFDSTSRHRRHCFDAGWEAALAGTLGMQTSLSQMVFWAICYQQDSKESTFMDAGHKKWIAREIAGAEALLGKEKK